MSNDISNPFANCSGITPQCPIKFSPLTYQPSLVANAIFLGIFIVCALAQLILGIRFKTWTFLIALFLGCVVELLGYLGRLRLNTDPWDAGAFTLQVTTLIIAPAFISAGIYLTLKHVVLTFGREFSMLKPALYTWIFICADITSLLVQAAGAALFGGHNSIAVLKLGAHIALAGIVLQVISLVVFGFLASIYMLRAYQNRRSLSANAVQIARSMRTHLFALGLLVAYITVLTRCIYRIPELAGGYRNTIYVNQTDFIVLDGVMISIATIALTILHPGIFFPQLSSPLQAQRKQQTAGEQYIELGH